MTFASKKYVSLIIGVFISIIFFGSIASAINGLIGHFDDTAWYASNRASSFTSMEVYITPLIWKGGDDGYYYSLSMLFTNGKNIYAGIQTNGYDGQKYIGKMAIFSVWDVNSGTPVSGGTGVNFNGEGTGYSVRVGYNWTVGRTYKLKIYISSDATAGNRTWAASITDLKSNQVQLIGNIFVPVGYGNLRSPVTFHERYMGPTSDCSSLSSSQVKFNNMTANNGTIKISNVNHYFKANIPKCADYIWTSDTIGGYISSVGVKKPPTKAPLPITTYKTPTVQPKTDANSTAIPATEIPLNTISNGNNEQVLKKSNNKIYLIIISITLITLILSIIVIFLSKAYSKHKNYKKFLHHHFPYDYDIHGPKSK